MKKIMALIIAFLLAATVTQSVLAYSDLPFLNGDVNLDKRLMINDATAIQKKLVEIITFSDRQMKLADFNLDGEVSIMDVTKIQAVLADLEDMPIESTMPTSPSLPEEYVTPAQYGVPSDANDDGRLFQKALDAAEKKGVPLNLEGKTYHIYTSEAKCPIINGSLKIMPNSSLVLTGDTVSLKNVNVSRWWKGDSYWYGDVRLHLTNGCVIEDCNFSSSSSSPSIHCDTRADNTIIRNCTFSEGFGILFNDGNSDSRIYKDVLYTGSIGEGLIVDNCTFNTEGKTVEFEGDNVEINTPNFRFSNVRVTNCVSYGAKMGDNVGMGFGFAQVDHLVCSNNILSDIKGSGAIHMEACTDVESKDNTVKNSHYGIMSIYNNGAVYENNTIEGCEYGIYCMAQYPYGYDEEVDFFNNTVLNCDPSAFIGSGMKNCEIRNNHFISDSNYAAPIIKLEYNEAYSTNNVTVAGNTINYAGAQADKNWAYIHGTDCNVYDNNITGLNPLNYINSSQLTVRLKFNLPSNTPMTDTLYFTSNLNNWNSADGNYILKRTSQTSAEIIISVPEGFDEKIEYKLTRGSWAKGECNADGAENVGEYGYQNHILNIYGNFGSGYSSIDIKGWTDLYK